MKIFPKLKIIVAIIAFACVTFSCTEDTPKLNTSINDVDLTTIGIIKGNPIFSQLVKAIELTGLSETLKNTEPHTLLAPADTAFNAFLKTTPYATINDVPKDVLKQIVLNHVLKGKVLDKDFTTGYIKTLATSASSADNNLSMYVNTTSGVVLNGVAKVTYSYSTAPNGVVHIVDNVIFLPTVVTHAQANPDLKSLVDNLKKPVTPDLVTTLSGLGPFTVFAPTNNAFTAFNTELAPGGLNAVSTANLTKVLLYHVANGNLLATSLNEGQVVATLETPQTFVIQLTGGAKIKDASNRISNITATNVQCNNGIIHIIDKVLLPKL